MEWPLIGRDPDLDHAVALVEAGTGLALLGQAGVGKSRLLHELGDRAEQTGKSVVRVVAAESTRSIPFAPFVELLPQGPTPDVLAVMGTALAALHEKSSGRGLVLTIDDAHHLDAASLALVIQAVAQNAATVCMTARTGERMEPDLVDLWTNGVIARLDLGPLSEDEVAELAVASLGSVDDLVVAELWRLSEGNPLVLHELIEGAAGSALVQDGSGVWGVQGRLAHSARLTDLIGSRIRSLPEDVRAGMDVVAVGSPIEYQLASHALGSGLSQLENRGLVTVASLGTEEVVIAAHPLFGEVLAQNLPEGRKRIASGRLASSAIALGPRVDPLRAAIWQSDSGELTSPDLAIDGATAALMRHDAQLAETLARGLIGRDPRADLIVGRALSFQQQFEQAEALLAGLVFGSADLEGEVASARAQNLGFGLGQIGEASRLLAEAVESVEDPDLRGRLLNERALISAISGDFADARLATEQVLDDDRTNPVSRAAAYVTLTLAQGMTGDVNGLESIIDEALMTADDVRDLLPLASDQVRIMYWISMSSKGRMSEAAAASYEWVTTTGGQSAMRATSLSMHCLALDSTGRHREATAAIDEAIELYGQADPLGLEPQAKGMRALHLGQQGDSSGLASIEDLDISVPAPRIIVWVERGRAWSLVADGRIDDAVDVLVETGDLAVAGEHFVWACFCYHDVVRLGRPGLVIDAMNALPEMPGASLIEAMRTHSNSLAGSDTEELTGVATQFQSFGSNLLAAEAWAQVAALESDQSSASLAVLQSMLLERLCQGSNTPALDERPDAISDREADVVEAVLAGATSTEVAEQLFLSPRTVENHLQSVYRKTGITSRDELRSSIA